MRGTGAGGGGEGEAGLWDWVLALPVLMLLPAMLSFWEVGDVT